MLYDHCYGYYKHVLSTISSCNYFQIMYLVSLVFKLSDYFFITHKFVTESVSGNIHPWSTCTSRIFKNG